MITVLGIGPGAADLRLVGTQPLLAAADLVIGAPRQLAEFDLPAAKTMQLPKLAVLKAFLADHQRENIVLLASGDPLLYGIGTWVLRELPAEPVRIVPGISSIQYCFHQLGLSMADTYLTSSHGRQPDFDFLLAHDRIGMVTDTKIGPYQIAQAILARGQRRNVFVGENLSYPDEKISRFTAATVPDREFGLNVVVITHE
ncbi:cobalt-precorrin-7 (C(5))-methyltransferase [Levilactobacillus cerevisiae]|uniref:cobalt-precorrin-7 (C(5))-methyltransferase n=1 Tax=Levilactobacillus cerevisiae TaxID=1704076 RepID=UPI000F7B19A3|nr:cobalt-precorrin-7 (C(5))-methyltransferase [Levilactobacillus cerevisiae]